MANNFSGMRPAEEEMTMTWQQIISQAYRWHEQVDQQVVASLLTTDLASLFAIQQVKTDYLVEMSLLSTLARKVLTTVETVIKVK